MQMDAALASFEFARAYVQARRHQATGAVRIPVVKDNRGKLVAVGRPVEWPIGVAGKVISKRYQVLMLETTDCYRLLSSTTLQTSQNLESSPTKGQIAAGQLTRQRSSTLFERMRSGVFQDQGECPYMEDGHVHIPDLDKAVVHNPEASALVSSVHDKQSLFAVIDGHGGAAARDFIQDNLLRVFTSQLTLPHDPAEALINTSLSLDEHFFHESSSTVTAGATMLTVYIRGARVWISNLGDCRAVVSRQGKATNLSLDQKPEDGAERSRIEAAGGTVEFGCLNGELRVSRAIGDRDKRTGQKLVGLSCTPEVTEYGLGPGDEFIIIASDGLWDVIKSQQAVDLALSEIQRHGDPKATCEKLIMEALHRHTEDNICVLMISLFSEEHLRSIKARQSLQPRPGAWVPRHRQGRGVNVDEMIKKLRAEENGAKAEASIKSPVEHDD